MVLTHYNHIVHLVLLKKLAQNVLDWSWFLYLMTDLLLLEIIPRG